VDVVKPGNRPVRSPGRRQRCLSIRAERAVNNAQINCHNCYQREGAEYCRFERNVYWFAVTAEDMPVRTHVLVLPVARLAAIIGQQQRKVRCPTTGVYANCGVLAQLLQMPLQGDRQLHQHHSPGNRTRLGNNVPTHMDWCLRSTLGGLDCQLAEHYHLVHWI